MGHGPSQHHPSTISGRYAVANVVGVQVVDGANHLLHDLVSASVREASTDSENFAHIFAKRPDMKTTFLQNSLMLRVYVSFGEW